MKHLLNLLAAVALLVWGTQLVRTGILRVFGASLRQMIAHSVRTPFTAAMSGMGVTALVQSSTATALIVSSFVGQGLMGLSAALAVMLGADLGTSIMAVLFSLDLSWLSPLFIFVGVVLYVSRQDTTAGRIGRVLIGLGLMLLALRLINEAARELTQSEAVRTLLGALTSDLMLEITTGAILSIVSYSSLATVLLTATLVGSGGVPAAVGLGLVVGANLGSGLLAVITTMRSSVETRQVPLGNLLFKILGVIIMAPLVGPWLRYVRPYVPDDATLVVLFHLAFNAVMAMACIAFTKPIATLVERLLPREQANPTDTRPRHLDNSALATPSLAISCAAREALHQADVVETMLQGIHTVIRTADLKLSQDLRKLDDTVDSLYSDIKYYMTKISREALDEKEGRRWTDIIGFTINMEQVGDIIERILIDIEDKKIKRGLKFSEAGMEEINDLHARLIENLRLAMSVFLNDNVRDAKRLMEEKTRFRELERDYAAAHLVRLQDRSVASMETSSLHIDLISDFKRINSLLCSVAYPILEQNNALAPSRLRSSSSNAA
ncbi:MAG: Na/Pi cotransporter family protein [Simplicispira suum]|uniref:Na/Pi cotransporter family protein n=1 Tax=Simplicispira suum TaxID=2109915 RepID=UPI001C6C3AB9|nr:Na/Pi cotransporter family protein [Simplicispira suum]MBW7832211.1 Na/Pi cotransporter family protein [Simplicispira suum]